MEAKTQVRLESLEPYRPLFPPATAVDATQKKGAGVTDTVDFIPKVVKSCAWQVEKFVNQELRGLSTYAACEKLWHFVKYHIKYEKDQRGLEQVRSPRRLIHDGKGDCDCFTTFIDTCLYTLGIRGIKNRITKYGKDHFQHIYPIVPIGNGKEIVMDCVVGSFNYEEPYTEKKDYDMDLQFLDGIPEKSETDGGAFSTRPESELSELGKLLKKKNSGGGGGGSAPKKKGGIFKKPILKKPLFKKPHIKKKSPEQKKVAKVKKQEKKKARGKKILKAVNKVNKFNPATALLRGGLLASMKLNLLKVAERLKWGYATREFAASKGMDMTKYDKVKDVLAKTEKIFYGAGGKPENLKKSILTGKGNKNNEVAMAGITEYSSMPEMLGPIYQDEFVSGFEGVQGLGQLGEPATATAITAASGAMATLAALLQTIGPLFPKKNEGEGEPSGSEESQSAEQSSDGGGESQELPAESTEETPAEPEGANEPTGEEEPAEENSENLPATTNDETEVSAAEEGGEGSESEDPPPEETTEGILAGVGIGIKAFWTKNKKWLLPVGIGAAVITGAAIICACSNKDQPTASKPRQYALSGIPTRMRKKGGKQKSRHGKKSMIALM